MNRRIARLSVALLVCFTAVVAQLSRIQVLQADTYNERPDNTRAIERDVNAPRGTISTADGVVVARSEPPLAGQLSRLRTYPEGELYAHTVGYFSRLFGATGVERTYNDELAGRGLGTDLRSLGDLFVDEERVGDVVLTLRHDVQQVARDALGAQRGSVVAVDPRDGELLALWSWPSYDPNRIAAPDGDAARAAREELLAAEGDPLLAKPYQERYFPGSTFKVVTASAGVASGRVTPSAPSYPVEPSYTPPRTTRPLRNFGGSSCGGTLFDILRVSCNTAFARMGVETLGAGPLVETAEAYGFNDVPELDLPSPVRSVVPTDFERDEPRLAQVSIGQNDVQATPLQMALVAAGVANEGTVMVPHAVREVRDDDEAVVERFDVRPWRSAVDPATATVVREAMLGVVSSGTAQAMAIPGLEVGGKTGTAQLGTTPPSSHAWVIGFAGPPGEPARVAVAVLVEAQPGASEQTGGRVAAPIARQVMEAAIRSGG